MSDMSPGTCLTNWVYGVVLWLCHRSDRWEAARMMKGNAGNAGVMSGRRRDYTVDTWIHTRLTVRRPAGFGPTIDLTARIHGTLASKL